MMVVVFGVKCDLFSTWCLYYDPQVFSEEVGEMFAIMLRMLQISLARLLRTLSSLLNVWFRERTT